MKKLNLKACLLLCAFFCLLIFNTFADKSGITVKANSPEDSARMKRVIKDANRYIIKVYGKSDEAAVSSYLYPNSVTVNGKNYEANYSLYKKYEIIVYWNGDDLSAINSSSKDIVIAKTENGLYKKGEKIFRYTGYDLRGNKIYNSHFPIDRYEEHPKYKIVKWKGDNSYWLKIIENNEDLKNHIMANFSKSLFEGTPEDLNLYFQYRMIGNSNRDLLQYNRKEGKYYKKYLRYLEAHRKHLSKLFRNMDLQVGNINLLSLPSNRVKGFSQYFNSNKYYNVVLLEYQNNIRAKIEIKHLAVDKDKEDPSKFKVSDKFHLINSWGSIVSLQQGENKSFKAKKSKNYRCLAYKIFKNEEDFHKAVGSKGKRKFISDYIGADEAVYKHQYQIGNDRPVIAFFYEKTSDLNLDEAQGNIVIHSEKYQVSKAIPVDENVKITVHADTGVLANYSENKEENTQSIPIYIRQKIQYKDQEGKRITDYDEEYVDTVEKTYSIYKLYDYKVYHLKGANVFNSNLKKIYPIFIPAENIRKSEGRSYSKNLLGISIPTWIKGYRISTGYDKEYDEYKVLINIDEEEYIEDSDLEQIVETVKEEMKLKIRNDYLMIDGKVILDDGISYGNSTADPKHFEKTPIRLVKEKHLIDPLTQNGRAETSGNLVYEKVLDSSYEAEEKKTFDLDGNPVFVHSPSANRTVLLDDISYDQRLDKNKVGLAVPLDHIMELDFYTDFQHLDEKGYGNRDYEEHLRRKSVRMDFDSYVSIDKKNLEDFLPEKEYFLKAGKIFSFEPNIKKIYYKAAPWAKEGRHFIRTYGIAKNALLNFKAEKNVNLNFNHYAAFNKKELYLTGRLFDFSIERVLDKGYYTEDKTNYYSTGRNNKEGLKRKRFENRKESEIESFIMPVSMGKVHKETAVNRDVKLGYPIVFTIKTMGTYYSEQDIISLKPHFYHIDKDGTIEENIAVYYRYNGKLLELASEKNALEQRVVSRDLSSFGDLLSLQKTTEILKNNRDVEGILDASKYSYKIFKPVFCYKPGLVILSYPFRTFIGPEEKIPDQVDPFMAMLSVQKWKGIYSLPSGTLIFKREENGKVNLKTPINRGSLGVYFEIVLSRNNNEEGAELSFVTDSSNAYLNEGYKNLQGIFNYITGTALLYSLEHRAEEDLKTQ